MTEGVLLFAGSWQSWVATVLGATVSATATIFSVRYFRDTRSVLVIPVACMLGVLLGGLVTVFSLDALANWGSTHVFRTIMEISWFQKAVVIVLAPTAGASISRLNRTNSARTPQVG